MERGKTKARHGLFQRWNEGGCLSDECLTTDAQVKPVKSEQLTEEKIQPMVALRSLPYRER